jgi:hypothetical protein
LLVCSYPIPEGINKEQRTRISSQREHKEKLLAQCFNNRANQISRFFLLFFVFLFFDIFISGISTQETEAQTEVSCGLQKFGKFLRQLGQNLKLLAGGLNYFF